MLINIRHRFYFFLNNSSCEWQYLSTSGEVHQKYEKGNRKKKEKKSWMKNNAQNLSIISEYLYITVFCSLIDRQMDKLLMEYILIDQMNLHENHKFHICIYLNCVFIAWPTYWRMNYLKNKCSLIVQRNVQEKTSRLSSSREISVFLYLCLLTDRWAKYLYKRCSS